MGLRSESFSPLTEERDQNKECRSELIPLPHWGRGQGEEEQLLTPGQPAATVAVTFWLPLKKLSGSYCAFTATSRSKFTP